MDALLDELLCLDAAGDYEGVVSRALEATDESQTFFILHRLLLAGRLQSAYALATRLSDTGHTHPLLYLARALGGIYSGNPMDEALGKHQLGACIDASPPELQKIFYNETIRPVCYQLVSLAFSTQNHALMLQTLEIIKAGEPYLRQIFDFDTETPVLEWDELRRRGRERSRLLEFRGAPAGAPRTKRRVIVAMRHFFFAGDPNSRPSDIAPRICAAMNAYGWQATHHQMDGASIHDDLHAAHALCRQENADMLVLDGDLIEASGHRILCTALAHDLRRLLPSLKIVVTYLDPWLLPKDGLISAGAMSDAIWQCWPSMETWSDPVFEGKLFQSLIPHAGNHAAPSVPLDGRISFVGGLMSYNWHRLLWHSAAIRYGLPIDWKLSSHKSDGLSALESYAVYMQAMAETGCSLSFSMRANHARILTGRIYETILMGGLLVQETTSDLDYYLVSGEHYLEFSSFSELSAIARLVAEHKEEAEAVRSGAHRFVMERYNDDKLISNLDNFLYYGNA